jgi:anaerobic dimethyl sulfoxide reductase subunit B (iron-sulfur subunit)
MSAHDRLAFLFYSGSCSGFKACQMACKDKNDLGPGTLWRKVYEIAGGSWRNEGGLWVPGVHAYNLSLACNHCEDPACLKACPTRAIARRDDGIVILDGRICVGCRYCEWSCPYGAPRYDAGRGIMTKCDLCADLVDAGGRPSCVAACPMRALDFGPLEELRAKYGGTDSVFPLPVASTTRPSLLIRPHRSAARAGEGRSGVANAEET